MKKLYMEAKDFTSIFDKLEGISECQLTQHDKLYKGYVTKYNEINEKLKSADPVDANQNFSQFRSLKVELVHNHNGAILHELYFGNLTADYKEPSEDLKVMFTKEFGSWKDYIEKLRASGMASRAGWAITAYNSRDGKLYNYIIDQHNMNVPVNTIPILVLDTWEHAFMVDYGTDKATYIKAFMKNIDWEVVHKRLQKALEVDPDID